MRRLFVSVGLLVLVVGTALAVIVSTHESRLKFHQLETLKEQAYQLDTQWNKLLIEESTSGQYTIVERAADRKLGMEFPDSGDLIVVKP